MTCTQPRTEVACICESTTSATRDDVCTAKDKSSMYLLAYHLCSTNVRNHRRILSPAMCRHTENKKQETVRSSINQAERQQLLKKRIKYTGVANMQKNNNKKQCVFNTKQTPLTQMLKESNPMHLLHTKSLDLCDRMHFN